MMLTDLTPETVAREFGSRISSLSRRMIQDQEKARDAAQEVWYEILKSLPSFKGNSGLSTWIYTIARRTINRYIEKEKKYSTRFLTELFTVRENDGIPEMEKIPAREHRSWVLEQCSDCLTGILHCLDNESRFIYMVRTLSPLSYTEIAGIFEKEEAAVRKIYSRARRKVNHFLNNQCFLFNPEGKCRCKYKEPLKLVFREQEYRDIKDMSKKLLYLQEPDTFFYVRDYWHELKKK